MSVHALGLLLQTVLEMSRKLVCYLLVNAAPASFCENRDIPADQNNYLFDGMRIVPLVSFFAILNLSSTIRCIYYSFVITISTCTYNTLSKGSAFWKLSSFKLRSATFMIKKNLEKIKIALLPKESLIGIKNVSTKQYGTMRNS